MSTPAQIAANIENAKSSTGPRTPEGKAVSSANGIRLGLFTAADFVRPGDEQAYTELIAQLKHELGPVGLLESNLVNEIRRAMWRLRRCGEVEANLIIRLDNHTGYILDPMEAGIPEAEKVQKSVDRARSQAHRLLHKCTAELRKLQTERQTAKELLSETEERGIANWKTVRNHTRKASVVEMTKQTQQEPESKPELVLSA